MPQMTVQQRHGFLQHIYGLIFNHVRFPFTEKPGSQMTRFGIDYTQLVNMFQDRVKQLHIAPEWMPWVVGEDGRARTFKAQEVGAYILVGFDVTLSLENGRHQRFRMLEQNPYKRDQVGNFKETAILAQRGHKLMWIIDATDPRRRNAFIGKILDGEFIPNKPRATTTFRPGPNGYGTVQPDVRTDQYGTEFTNMGEAGWSSLPDVNPDDFDVVGIV